MSIFELRQRNYMLILVCARGATIEPAGANLSALSDNGLNRKTAANEDPWDGME